MGRGGTAGKAWDSGSGWIACSYTENDKLDGRKRDFINNFDYSAAAPYRGLDLTCDSSTSLEIP